MTLGNVAEEFRSVCFVGRLLLLHSFPRLLGIREFVNSAPLAFLLHRIMGSGGLDGSRFPSADVANVRCYNP